MAVPKSDIFSADVVVCLCIICSAGNAGGENDWAGDDDVKALLSGVHSIAVLQQENDSCADDARYQQPHHQALAGFYT